MRAKDKNQKQKHHSRKKKSFSHKPVKSKDKSKNVIKNTKRRPRKNKPRKQIDKELKSLIKVLEFFLYLDRDKIRELKALNENEEGLITTGKTDIDTFIETLEDLHHPRRNGFSYNKPTKRTFKTTLMYLLKSKVRVSNFYNDVYTRDLDDNKYILPPLIKGVGRVIDFRKPNDIYRCKLLIYILDNLYSSVAPVIEYSLILNDFLNTPEKYLIKAIPHECFPATLYQLFTNIVNSSGLEWPSDNK
jgi:hypothetical protein